MDFEEYSHNYYKELRDKIFKACLVIATILFFVEIIMALLFIYFDKILISIISRIIVPSSINFISLFITKKVISSISIEDYKKNYATIFCFLIITSVIAFWHSFFSVCLLLPSMAVSVSMSFSSKRLLNQVFIGAILSSMFCLIHWCITEAGKNPVLIIGTVSLSFAVLMISYLSSSFAIDFIKAQTEYILIGYQQQEHLAKELKLDPLTRLYNRAAFSETVIRSIKSYKKSSKRPLMLALFDIDNFKTVNDTFGHANGDAVLLSLSDTVKEVLRGNRNIFRYGGDEFAIVFKNKTKTEATEIAKTILENFKCIDFKFNNSIHNFSISMGIAIYEYGMTQEEWFNSADTAMYDAKSHGKNQVVIAKRKTKKKTKTVK